jgi:serine/threonine protein kinase
MPARPPARSLPQLKNPVEFQKRPRRQWMVVQQLSNMKGAGNDGIFKVEIKDDPYDRVFIEKRIKADDIRNGVARNEVALLRQVGDHPNILKMVDHFIDEQSMRASVFMEFCDAGDLEEVLKASKIHGQVHERKIWGWFIGLADALVYCHRGPKPEDEAAVLKYWNVVIHQDIKPANIFLKTDSQRGEIVAKLADFGYSESIHAKFEGKESDAWKSTAWTAGFEAPEHPHLSGASDVWQLALTIACVCTSILHPWSQKEPSGKQRDQKQPAGRQYSQKLNEILSWCLNNDKNQRPKVLAVAKHLKEAYAKLDSSLPPDPQPLLLPGLSRQASQAPSASSPGIRADGPRQRHPEQRPGLPEHAFSDPGVQRMKRRGNGYGDFMEAHRNPMSPGSIDDVIYAGGGTPHGGQPGGFGPESGPGYGPSGYHPGYGGGAYPPGYGGGAYPPDYGGGAYPPGYGGGGYPPYYGGGGYGSDPRRRPGGWFY